MSDTPAWRRWAGRGIVAAFLGVAGWFAVRYARTVDWAGVGHSLAGMPPAVLVTAAALALSACGQKGDLFIPPGHPELPVRAGSAPAVPALPSSPAPSRLP